MNRLERKMLFYRKHQWHNATTDVIFLQLMDMVRVGKTRPNPIINGYMGKLLQNYSLNAINC